MRRRRVCLAGQLAEDESGQRRDSFQFVARARERGDDLSWYLPGHSHGQVWSTPGSRGFEGGRRSAPVISLSNVK